MRAESLVKEVIELRAALDEHAIVAITDPQGRIIYANDKFCAISHYSREELLGQDHRLINSGFHSKEFMRGLWTTIAHGKVWKGEIKNRAKDGSFYWVDTTIVPFRNREGKPRQYVAIRADITERKNAEEKLRENEGHLRQLLEHSPTVIYSLRVQGQNVIPEIVSDNVTSLLGFTVRETLSYDWWLGHLHPEDRDRAVNGISETMTLGASVTEYRIRHKDGSYRWVEDTRRVVRGASGSPDHLAGVWADITERKRAEDVLRQAGQRETGHRQKTILKELAVIFASGAALFAAMAYTDILQRAADQFARKNRSQLDDIFSALGILLIGFLVFIYRRWHETKLQSGRQTHLTEALRLLHDELEERVQQRTAELVKANATQAKLAAIVQGMNEACFALDKDWRFTFVNDRCETLLHHRRAEMLGHSIWDVFDRLAGTPMEQHYRRAMTQRVSVTFETLSPIAQCWLDIRLFPSGDGLAAFLLDIEERKRAEESTLRLVDIINSSQDAIVGKTLDGIITSWNHGAETVFGYSAVEAIGNSMLIVFPPERMNEEKELLARIARGESIKHFETERVRKDGRRIFVSVTLSPIADERGNIVGVSKIARDITERKRAEQALHETNERLKKVLDVETVGVMFWDLTSGEMTDANDAFLKLMGYSRHEVEARQLTWQKLTPPEFKEASLAELRKFASTGRVGPYEKEYLRKDGARQWMVFAGSALNNNTCVEFCVDISDRKKTEAALRETELKFRQIAENIREVFWITEPAKHQMIYISPAYEAIWGRTCESLYQSPQSWLEAIHPGDREHVLKAAVTQHEGNYDEIYRIRRPDGSLRWIHDRAFPVRNETGDIYRIVGVAEDITERQKLEEQYRQAQKMEAIGQLAGGVAHDFNNILAIIQMQAGLLKSINNGPTADVSEFADEISATVQRGAALTRQLLLFSRRDVFQACDLDLSASITSTAKMLKRVLGENIKMQLTLASQPMFVRADPAMMDQILLNLCVNARDAMSKGGQLVIETSGVELDGFAAAQSPQMRPGSFVRLSVSDNGCGIPPQILPKIFEPFFTTKGVGKGTGLGLATVFGIVQQHQGWINVYSEVNHGTTFRIYFPRLAENNIRLPFRPALTATRGGHETILLVEDDPSLRASIHKALLQLGYRVFDAPTGVKALDVWKQHADEIRLVLTDLVMPDGMTGTDLGRILLQQNSKLKVVYMSGYSTEIISNDLSLKEGVNYLTKPFQADKLAQAVRISLDS